MSIHDYRRKDVTQWTYYVVDHLTTMANVYRFDTPDAAIACYKGLDPSLRSAIGSSFGGVHELDHIHRCTNDLSVLVTSADSIETPLWRDSPEIQSAIDKMISALHVQHERNNTIFGMQSPSVIVELERNTPRPLDNYFGIKIRLTTVSSSFKMIQSFRPLYPFSRRTVFLKATIILQAKSLFFPLATTPLVKTIVF